MRAYNETKTLVLTLLMGQGEATATEVADHLGITQSGASSYLLKLHRKGLLGRRRSRVGKRLSRERIYTITEKGVARLDWLESKEEVFYADFVEEEYGINVFVPTWR